MFDQISERFNSLLRDLRGLGKITDKNIADTSREIRRILLEEQKLDGIINLPSGVFNPYSGVSTAILLFTNVQYY